MIFCGGKQTQCKHFPRPFPSLAVGWVWLARLLGTHVRHSVQVFLTFKHFFQLSLNSQFVLFTHTSMQITCNIIHVYYTLSILVKASLESKEETVNFISLIISNYNSTVVFKQQGQSQICNTIFGRYCSLVIYHYYILKSRSSSLSHYIVNTRLRVRSLRQKPVYCRNLLMLMYCR